MEVLPWLVPHVTARKGGGATGVGSLAGPDPWGSVVMVFLGQERWAGHWVLVIFHNYKGKEGW